MPQTRRKESLVWYASFGSNLMKERFLCTLRGGTPRGATQGMVGCTDRTPPRADRRTTLPYRLYFADSSDRWSKGGVAFVDPKKETSRKTHGRLYLITQEQFAEVLAQENRTSAAPIDFGQLKRKGSLTVGKGRYNHLLSLGELEGSPVVTITCSEVKEPATAPDSAYLRTLLSGVLEIHADLSPEDFDQKLSPAALAKYVEDHTGGLLDYARASSVVADALMRYPRVQPMKNRAGNANQFIVQPPREFIRRFNLTDGDRVLLKADHRNRTYSVVGVVNAGDSPSDVYAVHVDEKLRVAIGLEVGDRVHLMPIVEGDDARKGRCCEGMFELQPQLARVSPADFEVEETGACRLTPATLQAIGVQPGSHVRVQSVARWVRARAVELDMETRKRRERQIADAPELYPDPAKELRLDRLTGSAKGQDLPPVYLGAETCRLLDVRPCDPVRVVRDSCSVWTALLAASAVPFMLALLGAMLVAPGPAWYKIVVLLLGLIGTGWIACHRVRQ